MTNDAWATLLERAGALYGPVALAFAAGLMHRRRPRQFAGCLLSLLWVMTSLAAVSRANEHLAWWSFAPGSVAFCGIPLELYLGWTVLWGILPQLAFPRARLWLVAIVMAALDLVAMPLCSAVVHLGPHWLTGEAVAIAVVLLPALALARWTIEDQRLNVRASMQIALAAMLFLYWMPELVFALRPGREWSPLLSLPAWQLNLALQGMCVLTLPGVAAVMEFVRRGEGTPIPYDPPKRLVISGIYRFCANPMQISCAAVMAVWAVLLHNAWMLVPSVISIVYSAGIAAWDENADLDRRFGGAWRAYRAQVKNWRVRWLPYAAGPVARVYIARTCGPCSQVRAWLETHRPIGLEIVDAETLPAGSIRRMRYVAGDGSETMEGVRAMGRVLEHLNFGYAMCGAAMRLPMLWRILQVALDAAGLGPREIPGACALNDNLSR